MPQNQRKWADAALSLAQTGHFYFNGRALKVRSRDTWITLRWTRGTRYYRVHLEQDLWDDWLLTQVNGRIGTRLGRVRAVPAASIEAALSRLAAIAKRRRQRDYDLEN